MGWRVLDEKMNEARVGRSAFVTRMGVICDIFDLSQFMGGERMVEVLLYIKTGGFAVERVGRCSIL